MMVIMIELLGGCSSVLGPLYESFRKVISYLTVHAYSPLCQAFYCGTDLAHFPFSCPACMAKHVTRCPARADIAYRPPSHQVASARALPGRPIMQTKYKHDLATGGPGGEHVPIFLHGAALWAAYVFAECRCVQRAAAEYRAQVVEPENPGIPFCRSKGAAPSRCLKHTDIRSYRPMFKPMLNLGK